MVLTGAGMSAESGIATFRDSGGLWEQHRVEDVATPAGFVRNPQLVLDFYNLRRKQALEAKPNGGHIGLAEMQDAFEVSIVTQNVDDLHERAGSKNVLHLHGELMKVQSTAYPNLVYKLTKDNIEVNVGDKCERGSQLRPFIVWFGEAVPMLEEAILEVESADILVVIGTSLNVYPAAGLINYTQPDTPIYLIDPHEVKTSIQKVHYIQKGASEGVAELRAILKSVE